jgi:hypothetical protein
VDYRYYNKIRKATGARDGSRVYSSATQKAEAGGSLDPRIQGQPGKHSETLSKNITN